MKTLYQRQNEANEQIRQLARDAGLVVAVWGNADYEDALRSAFLEEETPVSAEEIQKIASHILSQYGNLIQERGSERGWEVIRNAATVMRFGFSVWGMDMIRKVDID